MDSDDRVDYRQAILGPFASAQWALNVLWVMLGMLVPLIGPIVVMGYQGTMVEALARGGVGAAMPDLQLERLAEYLLRGVRIFVVSLVVGVVVTPLGMAIIFVCNIVAAVLMGHRGASMVLGFLMIATGVALFLLLLALSMVLTTPLWVKAALESDLGRAFDFAFLRDFLRRAGKETLLAHLFLFVLNLGLMLVGFLACMIGMFPAMAIAMLVQAHVQGQLYLLYVRRGGTVIALPPPTAPAPPSFPRPDASTWSPPPSLPAPPRMPPRG
jgi:hypothetical protein